MRSRGDKFKQARHFVAFGAIAMLWACGLSGCAGVAAHQVPATATPADASSVAQPLAQLSVATPDAGHDVLAHLLEGQFAIDHGNLEAASAAYGRAAALSHDPGVAERAAQLAIATHDAGAARRAIGRWQALGASPAQLAAIRAGLALDAGDTDAARAQLDKLVRTGEPDVWRTFGRLLLDARDAAQAGHLLRSVATPDRLPADASAWLAMSELGEKLGQHAYARDLAAAAVDRFGCADCYAWAAQLQFKIGHHERARALYAKAVAKAPQDTRLRLAYAGMLGKQGDNAAAAKILAEGKQDAATYQARAAFLARSGDIAGLKRIYRELTRASDEVRAQSGYLLGQLAASTDQPKQALQWFARVPEDDPHRFDADMHTALIYQQQGKAGKAHDMARQMQMDYADDPDQRRKAIELDANVYLGERKFTQAIASFDRALRGAPDDAELLYGRGLARAEAGQTDAAIADLRKVLKLKPHDVDASNALGFTLADADRDLDEARKLLEHAHQARPGDPAITDSWGWLQYRLGNLAAAEQALKKAWQAADQDPEIGGHLAEVLWKQGQRGEARKILAAARKLAPDSPSLRALARKIDH